MEPNDEDPTPSYHGAYMAPGAIPPGATQSHMIARVPAVTPSQMAPLVPSAAELEPIPGIPRGLETFYGINSLYIQEQMDAVEAILDFEMNNRYFVFNPLGHRVFFAGENTGCCGRYCCGNRRPFKLNIFDCFGRPVLEVERPCSFWLWYCKPGVYGSNANVILRTTNEVIGRIQQDCSCTTPAFTIYDHAGVPALKIRGPCCAGCCDCLLCCDAEFKIIEVVTDQVVGSILKRFSLSEVVSDANSFGFSVRGDMDVRMKAVLLAAVFLIDFTYFEDTAGKKDRGAGLPPGVVPGHRQRSNTFPCQNCCQGCSGLSLTVVLVLIIVIIVLGLVMFKPPKK